MTYILNFHFDDGTQVEGVIVDRIVDDSGNELVRVDISTVQSMAFSNDTSELLRRILADTPDSIHVTGDPIGMHMIKQSAQMDAVVMLRFPAGGTHEDVFLDGSVFA